MDKEEKLEKLYDLEGDIEAIIDGTIYDSITTVILDLQYAVEEGKEEDENELKKSLLVSFDTLISEFTQMRKSLEEI